MILIEPFQIWIILNQIEGTYLSITTSYLYNLDSRNALKNVLTAISNTLLTVGYVQGLNYIVGILLRNFSEEESFWTLLYMMEKLELKNLFGNNFKMVNVLNYQLHYFTEYYFPEITAYLV